MSLYNLPNSTGGLDAIVTDTISAVDKGPFPSLTVLILALVFFVPFIGGILRQKMRTGTSDYAMWSVVASIMMFVTALIMTMITGIINLGQLSVVISITILSGVWLFLDRRQSEV